MNALVETFNELIKPTQDMRDEILDTLTDADLAYALPGNPTLGELLRELGEIEHTYVQSFKRFTQSFDYKHDDPSIATSLSRLRAWYKSLQSEMEAALKGLNPDEVANKAVDRQGWQAPLRMQLDVYLQALLIFYSKLSVYMRALGKPLSEKWIAWIN